MRSPEGQQVQFVHHERSEFEQLETKKFEAIIRRLTSEQINLLLNVAMKQAKLTDAQIIHLQYIVPELFDIEGLTKDAKKHLRESGRSVLMLARDINQY